MKKARFLIFIAFYALLCMTAFNYLILEQENVLKRYFIIEPQEKVKEFSDSLAGSLSRYFIKENKSASIDEITAYIKRYGKTSLVELLFVFKDKDQRLKQISKMGVMTVNEKILESKWVYPVTVDSGNVEGYLIVIMKNAGEADLSAGFTKYIVLSYSLRGLFLLLVVALSVIVFYHNYSAKMKLAKDIAEVKASYDGLTGLHTNDYFTKTLNIEVEKFRIFNTPIALFMLDIDNFKNFNDSYGHQAGDKVLQEVASLIKMNTRATDIVARYGGEEFAVIVPYVAKFEEVKDRKKRFSVYMHEIKNLAERIRKSIEENRVEFLANTMNVTISIGIAYYYKRTDTASPTALLHKADMALYKAKRFGRNKVVVDFASLVNE